MFLDDFVTALRDYPDNHVRLRITNFNEPGEHINPGENCTFRVRLYNNGHLDMNNVFLHLNGTTGITKLSQTDILGNPINFSNSLTTAAVNIRAHESWTSRVFYMNAERTTATTELIDVHIGGWDAGLGSLLRTHAGHDLGAHAEYRREIVSLRD